MAENSKTNSIPFYPRLLVFDLDGTLADTSGDIAAYVNTLLRRHGYPEHSHAAVTSFIGHGAKKLLERALPEGEKHRMEELYPELLHIYSTSPSEHTVFYPGFPEFFHGLKVPVALLTNKPKAPTEVFLKSFGLQDDFIRVICSDCGFPPKPDPSGLQDIMHSAGVKPAETLMVGDGVPDIQVARAAGVPVLVHTRGFTSERELLDLQPDYSVSSMSEFANLFAHLHDPAPL